MIRRTLLGLLVLVLFAGAGAGSYLITRHVRRPVAVPERSLPTPPRAYTGALATPSAAPTPGPSGRPVARAVRARLGSAVQAPALGPRLRGRVVDVASGRVLYDDHGSTPAAPASVAKLLTAAALLTVHRPTDRITTRAVAGTGRAVVLVGGGDPTLTGAATGQPSRYPGAARLTTLAAQIRKSGLTPTRIVVDDRLFTGPEVSPAWAAEDVPSNYGAAITATMTDGGRDTPDAVVRSARPDLAAGHELAAALGRPGLPVTTGPAPNGARELGHVESAPYATLIEQMLEGSDNVIAECLGRQVALAGHRPASFAGAVAAIRAAAARIAITVPAGMHDASGLAAADRIAPSVLVAVLRALSRDTSLRTIAEGLPVAAWSGTLVHRYRSGPARAGAGIVRAKTGTLTGVSSIAGFIHDASGQLLAFAFIADRAPDTPSAESALDVLATRLVGCGCG